MSTRHAPLRVLVLGGTGYIGPHLVEHALARGHAVTLFNRGKTKPGLFPRAEQLIGDRNRFCTIKKSKCWTQLLAIPRLWFQQGVKKI